MEDSFEDIDDEIFLNVDVEIEISKEKKSSQEVKKSSPDDSFDDISEDDDFLLTAAKCDDSHHSTKSDEDSILFTQPRPYEVKNNSPPTKKDSKKRPSPVIDENQKSKHIRFTQESVQEIKFSLDDEWFLTIQTPPGCSNAKPGKVFDNFVK